MRSVEDNDVDRLQVYTQQCVEPRSTNRSKAFLCLCVVLFGCESGKSSFYMK